MQQSGCMLDLNLKLCSYYLQRLRQKSVFMLAASDTLSCSTLIFTDQLVRALRRNMCFPFIRPQ